MTPTVVLPVITGALYAAGVYLLLDRSLTRVLLGFLLLGNATNVLLLAAGGPAGLAPILGYAEAAEMSDPLPQALILTAIVISFGLLAFALVLVYRAYQEIGTVDSDRLRLAEPPHAHQEIPLPERELQPPTPLPEEPAREPKRVAGGTR